MMKGLHRVLAPLRRGLAQMVSRAVIRGTDDSGAHLRAQVDGLADETLDTIEILPIWGISSVPHDGAEVVMVAAAGVRSHGLIIAVGDRRYRLKGMAKGEVALHDDQGQKIHLTRSGIVITSADNILVHSDTSLTFEAPAATFSQDVTINGDLTVKGDTVLGNGATEAVKLADDSPATKVTAK